MNKNLSLKRNNSLKGLKHLQRSLDSFFSDAWWPAWGNEAEEFQPLSQVSEDKNNYYVKVDLPGIPKEEIKVEVEDNFLRIYGERKEVKKEDNSKQHFSEIFYGSFSRDYTFHNLIDGEKVKAHYENGTLKLTIPKSSASKPKLVKIE